MYRSRILLSALLLSAVAIGGCKKEEKDLSEITLTNNLSEKVTMDVYASFEDYAGNKSPLMRKTLEAGGNTVLPGGTLNDGTTYYMDWYTDDYFYNNWFNDKYPVGKARIEFKPQPGSNTYYFSHDNSGKARSVFLRTGTSSRWTAINAYTNSATDGYVAVWQSISPDERYRDITVKKDFTVNYTYKNSAGTTTDDLAFMVHNTKDAYIELMNSYGESAGSLIGGELPAPDGGVYKTETSDTVLALFPDSEYYYLMVRSQ